LDDGERERGLVQYFVRVAAPLAARVVVDVDAAAGAAGLLL
jgi:hypothetical protein